MPSKLNQPTVDQGRRRFLQTTGLGAGVALAATVLPRLAQADDLPHLAVTDPTAAALGYTEDTNTVDAKKFPTHKPTQDCANCKFFTAGSGEYGPCQLFPGKSVHAKGWCSAHADKA